MISAINFSSSLGKSLLITLLYLFVPMLIATAVGTFLGLQLYGRRFYKQNAQDKNRSKGFGLFLSVVSSFPFSFLFLSFVALLTHPFSHSLSVIFPLLPLAFVASANFTLQIENYCNLSFGQEFEMSEALGLSKKTITRKVLLPQINLQLPTFMINTLLALLPAVIIVGVSSGLGIGGHFYLSWCNVKANPGMWVVDLIIICLFLVLLLVARFYLHPKNNK